MPKISFANNFNPLKQFYTDQQTKKPLTKSIKDRIKEQQEKSVREKDRQKTIAGGQSLRKDNIRSKIGQTGKKENQQNAAKIDKNPKEHQSRSKRSFLNKKIDIYA